MSSVGDKILHNAGQVFKDLWLHTNKYGRRLYGLGEEALVGTSATSPKTFTLSSDFTFKSFTANSTLNHSSAYHLNTNGQMGLYGGEGSGVLSSMCMTIMFKSPQPSTQNFPEVGFLPSLKIKFCTGLCVVLAFSIHARRNRKRERSQKEQVYTVIVL